MLSTTTQTLDEPDPINRQMLISHAAYLTSKHSVYDGLSKTPIFNMEHPVAFQSLLESMNNKEDILTQGQMLKAPDAAEFKKAQEPELTGLRELDVFEYVRLQTKPAKAKILRAVWSYRRKRRPDGTLLKYKARLCADGSKQIKGEDYDEA